MKSQFAFAQRCSTASRKGALALCLALCVLGLGLPAKAQTGGGTIITFDAPKAGRAPGLGTQALANNDLGAAVGFYVDANAVSHGFLRAPSGAIISLDAPGAGSQAGSGQGTVAYSINNLGEIAGALEDHNGVFHAFLRSRNGSFVAFDAPGAGAGPMPSQDCFLVCGQGTLAFNVNLWGEAAGIYIDSNNLSHGFARSPEGKMTSFDAPDASPQGLGTFVCEQTCLGLDSAVTGFYFDASDTLHGFVRYTDGQIAEFEAPEAASGSFLGTIAASITPAGVITGYSVDADNVAHGFVRYPDGSFASFDDPSASTAAGEGTAAFAINLFGAVTGEFNDENSVMHGFERFRNGSFANFNAPGAGTGAWQGTRPSTNNLQGEVAGWYSDANNVNHGFLWIP